MAASRTKIGTDEHGRAIWSYQDSGSAAINETIDPGGACKLCELRFTDTEAVGGAGDLTLTMDASGGASWDNRLLKQDMTAAQWYRYVFEKGEGFLRAGDKVVLAWANASTHACGWELIWIVL